jgi:glycosyltransferase involved in cell wall biosynthesis
MMRLHYISPSNLPSLSANSVHVIMQAKALTGYVTEVTLYACRTLHNSSELRAAVLGQYGIDTTRIRFVTIHSKSGRGINIRIALRAIRGLLVSGRADLIISRNLYAAYLIGVVARRALVFETHDIETGIRGFIQKSILRCPRVRIVCISRQLLEALSEMHGAPVGPSQVLHDAAPAGMIPVPAERRRAMLEDMVPEVPREARCVCGYFGHLYPGRGIEVIEAMANKRPDLFFLVVGGREEDVNARRKKNTVANLIFLGHVPHHLALQLEKCVDILLMPYQQNVSVGVAGRDTARWMSPMKMFEYMATGVPIISSDLPVLREILRDGENALLVPPDDPDVWISSIDRLFNDVNLGKRIALAAYSEYLACYTWERRAQALIAGG